MGGHGPVLWEWHTERARRSCRVCVRHWDCGLRTRRLYTPTPINLFTPRGGMEATSPSPFHMGRKLMAKLSKVLRARCICGWVGPWSESEGLTINDMNRHWAEMVGHYGQQDTKYI